MLLACIDTRARSDSHLRLGKAPSQSSDGLGLPLDAERLTARTIGQRQKAAGVHRITFHGLRHTSITLLLGAGVPVHIVAKRVGHKNGAITYAVYAHVLPGQQQDAAARLAGLLHG